MNLLKRLGNLWKLSAYQPSQFLRKQEMIDSANKTLAPITEVLEKFNKKAEIIKRGDPVEKFLGNANKQQ